MVESVPPLGSADIRGFLEDPSYSVYLYLGKDSDKGWQVAELVYGLLPRLRIYLVEEPSLIQDIIGRKRSGSVVYGWGTDRFKSLSSSDAESMRKVVTTIRDARKEP